MLVTSLHDSLFLTHKGPINTSPSRFHSSLNVSMAARMILKCCRNSISCDLFRETLLKGKATDAKIMTIDRVTSNSRRVTPDSFTAPSQSPSRRVAHRPGSHHCHPLVRHEWATLLAPSP